MMFYLIYLHRFIKAIQPFDNAYMSSVGGLIAVAPFIDMD